MIINKIIAVEGIDKTGKSTFCNAFETVFNSMLGVNTTTNIMKRHSFPNELSPIGKIIRTELASSTENSTILNSANFLSEMSHYWTQELFNLNKTNITIPQNTNIMIVNTNQIPQTHYLFDRYFISTLAYQAFYNNSQIDLDFIKFVLKNNKLIRLPTDLILLDLPNKIIIERTKADALNGLIDVNDTLDEIIIDKRRDAFKSSVIFLKGMGINIHWFEDVSLYTPEDLSKVLLGKIFK